MTMRRIFALAVALSIAGCAPQTFDELHVPYAAGTGYGYSEQRLDETRFVVTYNAPMERAFSYADEAGREAADREVSRAYEMALARAAEIALANGYQAFRVETRTNDAMSQNYEAWKGPFFNPQRNYAMDEGHLFARVTLVVALLPSLESGAYDASVTLATIRGRYAAPPA
jgi:hypothetical protein